MTPRLVELAKKLADHDPLLWRHFVEEFGVYVDKRTSSLVNPDLSADQLRHNQGRAYEAAFICKTLVELK